MRRRCSRSRNPAKRRATTAGSAVRSGWLVTMTTARSAIPALSAAALAVAVGLTVHTSAAAAPSTAAPSTAAPSATTPSATEGSSFAADELGYLDSAARCDRSQSLMAYGRTTRSLVAICVSPNGELEYRGERISDGASLKMPAGRTTGGSIVATNEGVTYAVSPTMFLVSQGDEVLYRDTWTEFHQPRFSPGSSTESSVPAPATTSAAPGATPSGTAPAGTPTVSTTTVTLPPRTSG